MREIHEVRDTFNRPHEVSLILRREEHEAAASIDEDQVRRMAIEHHSEGYGGGYVYLDLEDGKIVAYYFGRGESLAHPGHMILICACRDMPCTDGIFAWSEDIQDQVVKVYG